MMVIASSTVITDAMYKAFVGLTCGAFLFTILMPLGLYKVWQAIWRANYKRTFGSEIDPNPRLQQLVREGSFGEFRSAWLASRLSGRKVVGKNAREAYTEYGNLSPRNLDMWTRPWQRKLADVRSREDLED